MNISENGVTFDVTLAPKNPKSLRGRGGDPYGTRSRQTAFANLRVDASKRLNESVLIRKMQKP